jgi:uncharacterized FlgJ-related protein
MRLVTSIALVGLVSACGGQFNAGAQLAAGLRPPATSDPATAESMRTLEAEQSNDVVVVPVLDTKTQRESFLQDLNEQPRKTSDEQIAQDAETQFEQAENDRETKSLNQKSVDRRAEDQKTPESETVAETTLIQATTPNATVAVPKAQPAFQSTAQKLAADAAAKKPSVAVNSTIPVKPSADPEMDRETRVLLQKSADRKADEIAQKEKRVQAWKVDKTPVSTVHNEFCENLNVMSKAAAGDMSHLYNRNDKLNSTLPSDELDAARVPQKKNKFICALLPIAIRMNEEVYRQRVEVLRLQLQDKKGSLTASDQLWLGDIKASYGLDKNASFTDLLKRVDIVPLPMLLAQAANESGWGTSGATRDLNNIFGLHASAGQECKYGYDTNHACMRVFKTIKDGVSAYIRLLNSGRSYAKFREMRANMRNNAEGMDSMKLIAAMPNYNENPMKYIPNIRELMSGSNKLTKFKFEEEKVTAK